MVEFPGGIGGMALNLEADNVGVVMALTATSRKATLSKRTGALIVDTPVGSACWARRRRWQSDRRQGPIKAAERRRVDVKAPGIIPRKSVHEPDATGLKAIDALILVGAASASLSIGFTAIRARPR